MAVLKFGKLQLRIMDVLWTKERATAREITDELNRTPKGAKRKANVVAHSTVQTILRQLMDKGAVTHDVEGRTFIFRPTVQPDKVRRKATKDFVESLFAGSISGLVSYLIRNEPIPEEELDKLRELIDELREQ